MQKFEIRHNGNSFYTTNNHEILAFSTNYEEIITFIEDYCEENQIENYWIDEL